MIRKERPRLVKFQDKSSVEKKFCEARLTKNFHVHRFFPFFSVSTESCAEVPLVLCVKLFETPRVNLELSVAKILLQ